MDEDKQKNTKQESDASLTASKQTQSLLGLRKENMAGSGIGYPTPAVLGRGSASSLSSRSNERNLPTAVPFTVGAGESVATGETGEYSVPGDPGKKSNKTPRTPPHGSALKTSQRFFSNSISDLRSCSSEPKLTLTPMERVGKQLEELSEFIKNKSNVHHEIRRLLTSIRSAYSQAVQAEAVAKEQAAQEEKLPVVVLDTPTIKRKRSIRTPTSGENENEPKKGKSKSTDAKDQTEIRLEHLLPVEVGGIGGSGHDTNWTLVKRRIRRRRERPPRPDALEITTSGNLTYAEILKNMKSNPELKELGENVTRIRKTDKGSLLLQLGKTAGGNTPALQASLAGILGNDVGVKILKETDEVLMEIKDIDEITTKEEVFQSVVAKFDDEKVLSMSIIKSLRKAYGETQIAVVGLPKVVARRMAEAGKIRIGWVICRIREKTTPLRCYKCLDFGHRSRVCRSLVDRSKCCYKCGGEGHISRNCTNNANCMLCLERGINTDRNHSAGSSNCPAYRRALLVTRK
jgi:hypothetical protein